MLLICIINGFSYEGKNMEFFLSNALFSWLYKLFKVILLRTERKEERGLIRSVNIYMFSYTHIPLCQYHVKFHSSVSVNWFTRMFAYRNTFTDVFQLNFLRCHYYVGIEKLILDFFNIGIPNHLSPTYKSHCFRWSIYFH